MKKANASVLVVNDTTVDKHHGCFSVMAAIVNLLRKNNIDSISFWPAHCEWRNNVEFYKKLEDSNLVLVNGEGTIHHDRDGGKRLLKLGLEARKRSIPIALINAGWEANGIECVEMLKQFNVVSARDSRSARRMSEAGTKVKVVPDLSLWSAHSLGFTPSFAKEREGVGVTDNVDRFKSLSLRRLKLELEAKTVSIVYGEPGIVGWARFIRGGIALSEDLKHPKRLASLVASRQSLWLNRTSNTKCFISDLANLKLLISGRFHACTLALSVGTPLVAIDSNTDKISALFEDAGLEAWRSSTVSNFFDIEGLSRIGWTPQEYRNLKDYFQSAITDTELLFAELADLASN